MGTPRANALLNALGKQEQFYNAIETEVGQELLKDLLEGIERRIELVIKEEDDEKTRAELRAYRELLDRWTTQIAKFRSNLKTFTEKTND